MGPGPTDLMSVSGGWTRETRSRVAGCEISVGKTQHVTRKVL